MFYDVFVKLCRRKGVSPSKAAAECGINRSNVTSWKNNGHTPRSEALNTIADYFGVTTDYLLGNEQKEKALVNNDEELTEYLEMLRTRPGLKMMFQLAKDASKEDVERAVKVLEAMFGKDEDV